MLMVSPDQHPSDRRRLYASVAAILVGALGLWTYRIGAASGLLLDFRQWRVQRPTFLFRVVEFLLLLCFLNALAVTAFAVGAWVW
jgi:hypothetical protein